MKTSLLTVAFSAATEQFTILEPHNPGIELHTQSADRRMLSL